MLYVDEEREPHPEELHDLGQRTLLPNEVHGGHWSERYGHLKAVLRCLVRPHAHEAIPRKDVGRRQPSTPAGSRDI